MRRLRPGGVPLHPALVHFPVAFWAAAPALDVAALALDRAGLWHYARLALAAGSITALAAMAAGFPEYLAAARDRRARLIERHTVLAGLAWGLFTFNWLWRESAGVTPGNGSWLGLAYAGLSVLGLLLLVAAGHAGARLVYVHGVGTEGRSR